MRSAYDDEHDPALRGRDRWGHWLPRDPVRSTIVEPELDVGKRARTDRALEPMLGDVDPATACGQQLTLASRALTELATANATLDALGSVTARIRLQRALDVAARFAATAEPGSLAIDPDFARLAPAEMAVAFRPSRAATDENSRTARERPRWRAETSAWRAVRQSAAMAPAIDRRADSTGEVDGNVVERVLAEIAHARGGASLPAALASRLGNELHADLRDVRIFHDDIATRAAHALSARAFTIGDDIYVAADHYDTHSHAGIELIAHEVAHVVQHRRGSAPTTGVSKPGDAHERQAEQFASRFSSVEAPRPVLSGSTTGESSSSSSSPRAIHRDVDPAAADRVFHGATELVNSMSRVSAPDGIRLHDAPSPSAHKADAILPFNDAIIVARRTPGPSAATRWAYVISPRLTTTGFIEERYLATDPPEPTAKLVRVAGHDTLGGIAAREYGASISAGHDVRMFVHALYLANRSRPGIHLADANASATQRFLRDPGEKRTLEVYNSVRVDAGATLWLPSMSYIDALASDHAITSGSTTAMKDLRVLQEAGTIAEHIVDLLGGVIAGLLEGIFQAIVDVFKGALELAKMVFELIKANIQGRLFELLLDVGRKIADFFSHLSPSALLEALETYIHDRWTSSTWFGKGEFIGEVLGYIAANVLLFMISWGGSTAAMISEAAKGGSQLARAVLLVAEATELANNPIKLVEGAAQAVKLTDEAATTIRQALALRGKQVASAGEHAAVTAASDAETVASHGTAGTKAATHAMRTPEQLAKLDQVLPPKLRGRLVENPTIHGRGVHVSFRNRRVVIEVGPDATELALQGHRATAQALAKFEGPIGRIRLLIKRIVDGFWNKPGFGTLGHEAQLEVDKLTAMKMDLEQVIGDLHEAAGIGGAEVGSFEAQLRDLEEQIAHHEANIKSHAPGRGFVAAEDLAFFKGFAGSKAADELKATAKYMMDPAERDAVMKRVAVKAQAAGEQAYKEAIAAASTPTQARKAAEKLMKKTAATEALDEARRIARSRADSMVADTTAFAGTGGAPAKAKVDGFRRGDPFVARDLQSKLAGKTDKEFFDFMDKEVRDGRVPAPTAPKLNDPPQTMTVWEYSDGTVVRHKPLGDAHRPGPTFSVELKIDPAVPDRVGGIDGIALKVDSTGRPTPPQTKELVNPYSRSLNREQYIEFEDAIMHSNHFSLK